MIPNRVPSCTYLVGISYMVPIESQIKIPPILAIFSCPSSQSSVLHLDETVGKQH